MFGVSPGKHAGTFNHSFSQVPATRLPRSAFDRSFSHKTTCQASDLVPIFVDEVLPGDTFKVNAQIFARLSTPLVPAMDNIEVTTQFFFVPNRLLWTNWEKFCGAQDNPGDSISFTMPSIAAGGGGGVFWGTMDLGDYFGVPSGATVGGTASYHNALPYRAYGLIWNQWYRDENIQNSVTISTADGPDSTTNLNILQRGKKKDYFYGSLTSAQKGTAVSLLSGTAKVYGNTLTGQTAGAMAWQMYNSTDSAAEFGNVSKTGGALTTGIDTPWTGAVAGDSMGGLTPATAAQYTTLGGSYAPPYADLSTDTTDTINAIRLAFQTQKFLERDARGGTRYTELNLSHFGVSNPDARLQRSEYLGGGASDLSITPIPQTSATGLTGGTQENRLGSLAAFGTAFSNRNGFTKSFTEHGWVIGILNIRVKDLTYQQGMNKFWTRRTRYDHYWPVFANLGEQQVVKGEIYYQGDKAGANHDADVWGYQERWAEYKYKPNVVSGLFKSAATGTLDTWHFAQKYASLPSLDSTFIVDDSKTVIDRNLSVTHSATVSQFKVDCRFQFHCARVMPVYNVPGNIDRF